MLYRYQIAVRNDSSHCEIFLARRHGKGFCLTLSRSLGIFFLRTVLHGIAYDRIRIIFIVFHHIGNPFFIKIIYFFLAVRVPFKNRILQLYSACQLSLFRRPGFLLLFQMVCVFAGLQASLFTGSLCLFCRCLRGLLLSVCAAVPVFPSADFPLQPVSSKAAVNVRHINFFIIFLSSLCFLFNFILPNEKGFKRIKTIRCRFSDRPGWFPPYFPINNLFLHLQQISR